MAISFNPQEAQSAAQIGALPPSVEAIAMEKGALTNSHFLAIPFNASARAGAKVVANFLLSPAAQARKANPAFWVIPACCGPMRCLIQPRGNRHCASKR